jgi:hypothetical protein
MCYEIPKHNTSEICVSVLMMCVMFIRFDIVGHFGLVSLYDMPHANFRKITQQNELFQFCACNDY